MPALTGITRLGTHAAPTAPGPFSRVDSPVTEPRGSGPFTRLGLTGTAARLYGSFAGKVANTSANLPSAESVRPRVTIGPVTDVDTDVWADMVPRVTLTSVVSRSLSAAMTIRPRATMARGQVQSSSIFRTTSESVVPRVTLAYRLSRPQASAQTAIPVVTLAASVDATADAKASAPSIVPKVTLSASRVNLFADQASAMSAVPVVTLNEQVDRLEAVLNWTVPMVITPSVGLDGRAIPPGDVDDIRITERPCGVIRITEA